MNASSVAIRPELAEPQRLNRRLNRADRAALTDPAAVLTDGAASRRCPRRSVWSSGVNVRAQLTPKIEAFLAESAQVPTPFVVVDLDVVE